MQVVVLGGGSSGEHFVGALRRLDAEARLTLVERRLVGGECSHWACMPTKTMLRGPELVAARVRPRDRHRAEVPLDVLLDVIQPYPTFSEAVFHGLRELNLGL